MRSMSTIVPGTVAELVYDGPGYGVRIPQEAGTARSDQMQGSEFEQLAEGGGRLCYDSLGQGRPSFDVKCDVCNNTGGVLAENAVVKMVDCTACGGKGYTKQGYHRHILDVGHLSVWEHGYFTVAITAPETTRLLIPLLNRPGTWVRLVDQSTVRLTMNMRAGMEWTHWFTRSRHSIRGQGQSVLREYDEVLHHIVLNIMSHMAPNVCPQHDGPFTAPGWSYELVQPETTDEVWISLFLQSSRGWSHEQVRHGDFTAISQRSTRFVDEHETPWVLHPLLRMYMAEVGMTRGGDTEIRVTDYVKSDVAQAKQLYKRIVDEMQPWLQAKMPQLDKTTARKQCRGAARGLLGNALMTNMLFSASVAQWKTILRQRGGMAADWEMRELTCCALRCLWASTHAASFMNFRIEDEPNGLGQVVVEG